MSSANLPGRAIPATPNGARTAHRNRRAAKRDALPEIRPDALPEPEVAPFATKEPAMADAEMWPVHGGVWFQPDQTPAPPAWSSLVLERQHRIAAPDFAVAEMAPLDRAAAPAIEREALSPRAAVSLPASDLVPAGWDPRALCPKEERQ